ncbi:MAG: glycosyltransferase [Muribaculum sp.]|nr:glycosyltransferase [Muribaculum sp.]
MPKVSIVMPVYNGERFLKTSIESVIDQTFSDWELLIVNDCSSDGSPAIMEEYAEKDHRIHVIHNLQNQKLPRSLNIGFDHASGEYWTWTSDDNIYDSQAIETMADYLDEHQNVGLVYTDMHYIDENGEVLSEFRLPMDTFFLEDVVGASFMYRAECAKKAGGYDPDVFLVEDYDYWLQLRQVTEVARIPQFLYWYRLHPDSLTMRRHADVKQGLQKMRLKHLDFILQNIDPQNRERLYCDMYCIHPQSTRELKEKFFAGGQLPENLLWLERERSLDRNKKAILFGSGDYGYKGLHFLGEENVFCYADNNSALWGKEKHGKKIINFEELKQIHQDYQIILSVDSKISGILARQLESAGIYQFVTYLEMISQSLL